MSICSLERVHSEQETLTVTLPSSKVLKAWWLNHLFGLKRLMMLLRLRMMQLMHWSKSSLLLIRSTLKDTHHMDSVCGPDTSLQFQRESWLDLTFSTLLDSHRTRLTVMLESAIEQSQYTSLEPLTTSHSTTKSITMSTKHWQQTTDSHSKEYGTSSTLPTTQINKQSLPLSNSETQTN